MRRLLLLLLLLPGLAQAAPSSADYAGRIVKSVAVEGGRGLDEGSLRYLIEQAEGQPWDVQQVGRSVELIFRLGQFEDVQARVKEVDGGLALTFVVTPAPRIRRVLLKGANRLPSGTVRAALRRGPGDPYVTGDEVRLAQDVEAFYEKNGYLDCKVTATLGLSRLPGGGKVIELRVEEGAPWRIGRIDVPSAELSGFSEARIKRLLQPLLREGAVYREQALQDGMGKLLEKYRELGFVEARYLSPRGADTRLPVPVSLDRDTRTVRIQLLIDAGIWIEASYEFDGARQATWTNARLSKVIALSSARRVSPVYAEDAARRLQRFLRSQGYFHADVTAELVDGPLLPRRGVPEADAPQRTQGRQLRFALTPGPQVTWRPRDLVVDGNDSVADKQVLQVLTEASPTALGHRPIGAVVFGVNDYRRFYTQDEMDGALSTLQDYYRARGYLNVSTSHAHAIEPGEEGRPGRRVTLAVQIEEGARTFVEGLEVAVAGPVTEQQAEQWRSQLVGKPFDPRDLDRLENEVRRLLSAQGYLDMAVSSERELSDDGTLVRLRLVVDSGPQVRLGQTLVRDNRRTHVGLIRREAGLKVGELFDGDRLTAAQTRLVRTELFDGVSLRPAQTAGRVRDVELRVRERDRFSFVFGTGVTWPDNGPRVNGEVRARNLDGRGLSLFARGRASLDWRFISVGVTPQPEWRAALGLDFPWIARVPLQVSLTGVINEEIDEPTYRVSRSSIVLSARTRGLGVFALSLRGQAQFRAPLRVDPAARLSAAWDQPTDKPFDDAKLVALFGASFTVDGRDDRLNPKYGVYLAASIDSTIGNLPTTSPGFGQASARVVGLVPFGDSGIGLRLEGGGGVAWSYTDGELPPVEWRFRLGGIGSVRGFRLDAIGPQGQRESTLAADGLLHGEYPLRTVTVGGTAFYRYSIELGFPVVFARGWTFALFHDAGNALLYGTAPDGVDAGFDPILYPSVGFGLRRATPIGPLRFDFAVRPLQAARVAAGEAIYWDEVFQLHFAVGTL
jgi:translocation and assembly module TamA